MEGQHRRERMRKRRKKSGIPCLLYTSDLSRLQVKISVDENDISDINIGQSVKITGSGFKDKEYHGTVQKIYPSARQQQSGTNTETVVDAIVSIDDADEYIKPGFNIRCV